MSRERPVILIVDDARVNRAFVKRCLQGHGYDFREAVNGQQALQLVHASGVDLIILDLLMPVMDGFGFLRRLKADPRHATIPVIVNSSLDDMKSIQKALSMGSYDYFLKSLPKEESRLLLPLKVGNAIQAKLLLDEVCEKKAVLEREIQAAGKYQRFLLPRDFRARGMEIAPFFQPHLGVGGDFFDFLPLPDDNTAFIIADVSGHGVLSAMVAALLKPLFAQYMRETCSPLRTMQALNRDFLTLTDDEDYITAFVAVYDPHAQTLCYANAGHPPALYAHHPRGTVDALTATGVFLGLFTEEEWLGEERVHPVAPQDRLLLVTDGVIEARTAAGTLLGVEGLKDLFASVAQGPLKGVSTRLWQALQDVTRNHFTDDVTFVAVGFHDDSVPPALCLPNDPRAVLQAVDTMLVDLGEACSPHQRDAIRISVVEMLMNAIEHGNLAIGYVQKREALEASTFDDLVEQRRRLAPYATRMVRMTYSLGPSRAVFTIRDEGEGFDWRSMLQPSEDKPLPIPHGRGILIARASMDECWFNERGNEVTLVKHFSPQPSRNIPTVSTPRPQLSRDQGKDRFMQAMCTLRDNIPVITLSGPVDFASRKTLRALIDGNIARGCRDFILNLQGVTFIDSSGLGALVACYSTVRKQGGSMRLVQVSPLVHELMEMTRLTHFFDIYDTETEAMSNSRR